MQPAVPEKQSTVLVAPLERIWHGFILGAMFPSERWRRVRLP
jgi:hypothetical protein